MDELNNFFNLVAEGKETDPTAIKSRVIREKIKNDLASMFSDIAVIKADPPLVEPEQPPAPLAPPPLVPVVENIGSLFRELALLKKHQQELADLKNPKLPEVAVESVAIPEPDAPPEVITELSVPETPAEVAPPETPHQNLMTDSKKYLDSSAAPTVSPDPADKLYNDIAAKIRLLEHSISKIVNAGPGSGEVNLRYLDDIDRSTIQEGHYLTYNATTKKFEFTPVIATGGGYHISFHLNAAQIAAKQIELPAVPTSEVMLHVLGGSIQKQNVDFSVSGNILSWNSLSLELLLESNDYLLITYL